MNNLREATTEEYDLVFDALRYYQRNVLGKAEEEAGGEPDAVDTFLTMLNSGKIMLDPDAVTDEEDEEDEEYEEDADA